MRTKRREKGEGGAFDDLNNALSTTSHTHSVNKGGASELRGMAGSAHGIDRSSLRSSPSLSNLHNGRDLALVPSPALLRAPHAQEHREISRPLLIRRARLAHRREVNLRVQLVKSRPNAARRGGAKQLRKNRGSVEVHVRRRHARLLKLRHGLVQRGLEGLGGGGGGEGERVCFGGVGQGVEQRLEHGAEHLGEGGG